MVPGASSLAQLSLRVMVLPSTTDHKEVNRLFLLARSTLITLLLGVIVLFGALSPGAADAKWKPGRAYVDPSFGFGGSRSLLIPKGLAITVSNERSSAAAGPNGSFFAVYSLESRKTEGPRGGMIVKFNAAGELDQSFGRGGYHRIRGRTGPTRLTVFSDGSMLVLSATTASNGGTTKWLIHRRTRSGRFDQRFGKNGYLYSVVRDPENSVMPVVAALRNGRFAVALKDSSGSSSGTLIMFDRRGQHDQEFGEDGRLTFDFEIDSVAPAERGRIVVAGSNDAVSIAKLHPDGGRVRSWGKNGIATLARMPRMAWTPFFSKGHRYPSEFAIDNVQAIALGRSVSFTAQASDWESDDGTSEISWAARFDSRGRLDRGWGRGGGRFLGGSGSSSEGDSPESWRVVAPMADGRIFSSFYFSDEWGELNESTLGAIGRSGKKYARGSRGMKLNGFNYLGLTTSWDGRYVFAWGERGKSGPIAMRIRL